MPVVTQLVKRSRWPSAAAEVDEILKSVVPGLARLWVEERFTPASFLWVMFHRPGDIFDDGADREQTLDRAVRLVEGTTDLVVCVALSEVPVARLVVGTANITQH